MKPFLRACRDLFLCVLVVALLFGGWVLWAAESYRSDRPAGPTLADHLANRPPPWMAFVYTFQDKEYLFLHGPMPPFLRFPSGEPVYVFDAGGELVDWTPDEGDAERFHQRWRGKRRSREATAEEVDARPGSGR